MTDLTEYYGTFGGGSHGSLAVTAAAQCRDTARSEPLPRAGAGLRAEPLMANRLRYWNPATSSTGPSVTEERCPRSTRLRKCFEGWKTGTLRAGNRDRLSGPGVAGGAGLLVPHLERPEAPDFDALALHERVLHRSEKGVYRQGAVPLGDSPSDRFGDPLNEIGFGHPFSSPEVWPSLSLP